MPALTPRLHGTVTPPCIQKRPKRLPSAQCQQCLNDALNRPEGMARRIAFSGKKPRQKAGGGEEGRKRLHAGSLDEKEKVVCDAAHIRPANELVFSCRNSVKENVKDMLRGINVSNSMFAFVIENSKLIMVFLLIGTIIGLSSFGSRPYQDAMRE